jgi:hypothetical protein
MSKNSIANQKIAQSKSKKLNDGVTNTTTDVNVEAPVTYSKVERAAVQAGELDPIDIVAVTGGEHAVER